MIQSWNTIDLSENKAEIHQKWVNNCSLKNRRPVWSPINPNLINKGGLETANYPIVFEPPKLATQECKVWFKPEFCPETMSPNTFDVQLISICAGKRPVGGYIDPKNPKQIIYKDAIEDGIDLVYGIWDKRNPSFEKVIVFRKCTGGEYVDIDFEVKFPGGKLKGLRIFSKGGDKNISFENPVAWYYLGNKCIKHKIDIALKEVGNHRAVFTKKVPTKLIKAALSVGSKLFCDATVQYSPATGSGGTSCDATVTKTATLSTWDQILSGDGTATNSANTTIYLCRLITNTVSGFYDESIRSFISFPTSSLGNSNLVSSVDLGFKTASKSTGLANTKSALVSCQQWIGNSIANSDYSNFARELMSDTILDESSLIINSYSYFSLNGAGLANINTGGLSKFTTLLYSDYLYSETDIAANSTYYITAYSADQTGTSSDPILNVTYFPTNPKAFLMF